MDSKRDKPGVSVKEIQGFARRHKLEVFFSLMLILTCFFSFVFFGAGWSVVFGVIGGLCGVIFPIKTGQLVKSLYNFAGKQEKIPQLIIGVVALIISIFLPFLVFLLVGLAGGKHMQDLAVNAFHKD